MNNEKLRELLDIDRNILPPDGGELYNRLIFARSPYLLQHAKNPVAWREWGEEAFAEARRRGVPLFVSIGYATCHWCHVMAEESFSDSDVAAVLNDSFIPVKVDREERPDLDEFYMTAARVLTGGGGWPLNVFIDHDRRPFFSFTYLPKLPRHKTPGFMELLRNISLLWSEQRKVVFSNAQEICSALSAISDVVPSRGRTVDSLAMEAIRYLEGMYDEEFAGFGSAVKFPMPVYLMFLLSRNSDKFPLARKMALKTLERMMNGGIHDQLGGGFHRYTVDRKWHIPHFEKMLYDQAMLIMAFCYAFQLSGENGFLETAKKTAGFVLNELMTIEGGFCAALDADSEGEEGLFYTWDYEELTAIIGDNSRTVLEYWGVIRGGDLDGRCILRRASTPDKFAGENGIPHEVLEEMLSEATTKLMAARGKRERPLLDLKVISAWNGLMIAALARLSSASGESIWLEYAEKSARFILSRMVNADGRLSRNWLGTPSPVTAFAEDYANFCFGLLELVTNSHDPVWSEKLDFFVTELSRLFVNEMGDVSFCGIDAEKMPLDIPVIQDGVMPSTAGLCAVIFARSGRILGNRLFVEKGKKIIERYRGVTERNPAACLTLIIAEEELGL